MSGGYGWSLLKNSLPMSQGLKVFGKTRPYRSAGNAAPAKVSFLSKRLGLRRAEGVIAPAKRPAGEPGDDSDSRPDDIGRIHDRAPARCGGRLDISRSALFFA